MGTTTFYNFALRLRIFHRFCLFVCFIRPSCPKPALGKYLQLCLVFSVFFFCVICLFFFTQLIFSDFHRFLVILLNILLPHQDSRSNGLKSTSTGLGGSL
uniref:(northern house mosquito) hypothetical protein n=1 Tax=Culex pipiens TaxID=7175 RepID=A0A8D8D6R7_CULPI